MRWCYSIEIHFVDYLLQQGCWLHDHAKVVYGLLIITMLLGKEKVMAHRQLFPDMTTI